jgi:hypothetical protein
MCSINLDKEFSLSCSSILVSMHWVGSGVHHHCGLHRHVPYHYQRTDSGVYSHVLGGVGAALPISVMGWIHLHAREREEKKKKHQEEENLVQNRGKQAREGLLAIISSSSCAIDEEEESDSKHNYESDDDDDFNNSEWELEE